MPLIKKTRDGEVDLALVWGDGGGLHAERVAEVPIQWIGRQDWPGVRRLGNEPIPFAAFAPPCAFRSAATASLDAGGLPWRLVFTSPSIAGLWAAAEGRLAITARTTLSMPKTLTILDPAASGLPELPHAPLALHAAEADARPAVAHIKKILLYALDA